MTCVWDPDPACLTQEWNELTPEEQQRSLMLATSSLQMLTYNRVGTCPIIIRPCSVERPCGCDWEPYLKDGQWYNGCAGRSSCQPLSEVDLPGPVGYVSALIIDGVAVVADAGWNSTSWDSIVWDPQYDWADFRLDEGHLLVWQGDGPSPFPETQDLNKPITAPGTWGIEYSRSHPVGPDARLAVGYLAMEFAKACKPKKACSLPRGVTSVVRNGVSFTVDEALFPGGLTGIDFVDSFILKWAPAGAPTQTAMVFDPRKRAPRRVANVPLRPGGSL